MTTNKRISMGTALRTILGSGVWLLLVSSAVADDGPAPASPGFQGFGIGYHLGYGYGGNAVGVGPDGGYPFYGGPGYPHLAPRLRRLGGINPFAYYGGPGRNVPGHCNFFEMTGALVNDPPVIRVDADPGEADYGSGYGPFTGTVPHDEKAIAPYTTALGESGGETGRTGPVAPAPSAPEPAREAPAPIPAPPVPDPDPAPTTGVHSSFGIDSESVVDARGVKGLKVNKVTPGSPAESAGLHVGDVIESMNGHVTQQPGHLTWVIANAAPDKVLKMSLLKASERGGSMLVVRLP